MFFFFFNDTATTEIYTLSLHDALPISWNSSGACTSTFMIGSRMTGFAFSYASRKPIREAVLKACRSEEHTSELQSRLHLVCRLLLEKKKKQKKNLTTNQTYQIHLEALK